MSKTFPLQAERPSESRVTSPTVDRGSSHSHQAEKQLARHILRRLKDKKISLRKVAELLQPRVTASQVHHILSGKGPLSLERFFEFARILQVDPLDLMMESSGHPPSHAYLLTAEQESLLCESPLMYKLAYTCFHSKQSISYEKFCELFPESQGSVRSCLKKLVMNGVLKCARPNEYESPFDQIPKFHFRPEYDELVGKLAMDYHRNAAAIGLEHPDLAKFVLTKYHLAFLTPEQMVQVRSELLKLQEIIWNFQHQNQSNAELVDLSRDNFMALMTFFAPVNAASFARGSK